MLILRLRFYQQVRVVFYVFFIRDKLGCFANNIGIDRGNKWYDFGENG